MSCSRGRDNTYQHSEASRFDGTPFFFNQIGKHSTTADAGNLLWHTEN
jgi:hypothetical protein